MLLRLASATTTLCLALFAVPTFAYSAGGSGHAVIGCSACHTGSNTDSTVTVTFDGPGTLNAGQTGTYTMTINGGPGKTAGLDVGLMGGGTLAATGAGTRLAGNEVTHSAPGVMADGRMVYTFTVTAPDQDGTLTLQGTGISCDGDGTVSGDKEQFASLPITVQGGSTTTSSVNSASVAVMLKGSVYLHAGSVDPTTTKSVTFLIDQDAIASSSQPPYDILFDTRSKPDGSYLLTVSVTDTTGGTTTSSATPIIIANGAASPTGCSTSGALPSTAPGLSLLLFALRRRRARVA